MAEATRRRTHLRDNLLAGLSVGGGVCAGFAMVALVAHQRGAAVTGVLFGAIGLHNIVATAGKLGTETTFVYFGGRLQGTSNVSRRALQQLLTIGLVPVVAVSTTCAVGFAVSADFIAGLLIDPANREAYASAIRVLAPAIPVWAVTLPLLGLTRGLGDAAPTTVGLQLAQPLHQLLAVGLCLGLDGGMTALTLAWTGPLIITLAHAVWALARVWRTLPARDLGEGPPTTFSQREFWSQAGPRGLAGTLTSAVDRLGVVLVGSLGSAQLAGCWAVVTRLLGITSRLATSMSHSLNARLPALLADGKVDAGLAATRQATRWTAVPMLPVLSVLAVFPEAVLAVFGMAGVDNGPEALRLATFAALAGVVLGHADNLLLMAGRSRTVLYDTIPALVVLVVGTSSLLGVWGLLGAAVAWIGSAWTYRLAAMIQARNLHGEWLIDRLLGTEVALVASTSLAIGWCLRLIGGSSIVAAATAGLIGSLVAMARLLRHQPFAAASPPPDRQASVSARAHE